MLLHLSQRGSGSNGNQGVLPFPQISKAQDSPSEGLISYPRHSLEWGVLTPLQRRKWCILQPQLTGLTIMRVYIKKIKQNKTNRNISFALFSFALFSFALFSFALFSFALFSFALFSFYCSQLILTWSHLWRKKIFFFLTKFLK